MPSSHRRYRDWTHERIHREAAAVGDNTAILVEVILRSRPHPEQGFRSCIGILGLVQTLRRRTARRRLRPGAGARHPLLQLGRRDPEECARKQDGSRTGDRSTQPDPREHSRPRLLPLKGKKMLIHPTVERLRALGLTAMADAFIEMQQPVGGRRADPRGLARPAGRPRGDQPRQQAARPPIKPGPIAPDRGRRGRQPAYAARARPRPVPKAHHLRLDPRHPPFADRRSDRYRQIVVGLRARPQGLP